MTILGSAAAHNGLGGLVGAFAVLAGGAVILPFMDLGPLSGHMVLHIASMNVAAPLIAVAFRHLFPAQQRMRAPTGMLWFATASQLALLWASHSPVLHHMAQGSLLFLTALQTILFFSALAFWTCIVDAAASRWQTMLALLVSGKFACLLGVLLIFAPRLLFVAPAAAHAGHSVTMSDQHLAGLLMVAACPLSYVTAAIVIAAQTLSDLERAGSPLIAGSRVTGRW